MAPSDTYAERVLTVLWLLMVLRTLVLEFLVVSQVLEDNTFRLYQTRNGDGFEAHVSIPATSQRFSLDEIRDFMRRRLARISTDFIFGRFSSVHSIIERFFKTSSPVTISHLMCPNRHVVNTHRSQTSSCEIIIFAQPGLSLQHCIDDFTHSTTSRCLTCDTHLLRTTSFIQTPPVIIFDLGACVPSLPSVIRITCGENARVQVSYNLRGIIYYKDEHFTSHFITGTGMIWFHDGMLTGNSLIYEGQNIDSITTETAVMAVYTLDRY